jgi:hypothetical protein
VREMIEITPMDELPRWSLIRTPGTTLTFDWFFFVKYRYSWWFHDCLDSNSVLRGTWLKETLFRFVWLVWVTDLLLLLLLRKRNIIFPIYPILWNRWKS